MHGNDTDSIKQNLLSKDFSYVEYAKQFCKIGNWCDINQVEEYLSDVVSQLMLFNGYDVYNSVFHSYYHVIVCNPLIHHSLLLPEQDFGKILGKSLSTQLTEEVISTEALTLILRALYGEKSVKEASF